MKRYDYIQFGALSVLSHIAQGAAFILLFAAFGGTGTTSSFTFATPVGLALGVVYVSALSFLFGWGLRPERGIDKNRCWNAAMALYVLNLASLLAHPTVLLSFGGGFGSILGDGLGAAATACAWSGDGGVAFPARCLAMLLLALLAAVEPLCFTLGLTRKGKKPAKSEDNENSAAFSADAEAAITNEENNTNA